MSLRQIVLDTETTGLDPAQGHRVIEIGALELVERRLTGASQHFYLQPDRMIDVDAQRIHGISNEFLAAQPRFAEIVEQFLDFVRGAELIIHNAPFDLGFLNHELRRCGRGHLLMEQLCTVEDTLLLARRRHPGQRNSLDALCKRYNIDNSQRSWHGALLDAQILAEVYLAMTREQRAMFAPDALSAPQTVVATAHRPLRKEYPALPVLYADPEECAAHASYLELLDKSSGGACVWRQLDALKSAAIARSGALRE